MATELKTIFGEITDKLHSTASVRTVFGDPVKADGKTIVPVAKVCYGFGAGAGNSGEDSGGGGGGGIRVTPTGALEITGEQTRFVAIRLWPRLMAMLGLGLVLGLFAGRRCRTGAS
jgi:uncharacterized spore protein YtfJ